MLMYCSEGAGLSTGRLSSTSSGGLEGIEMIYHGCCFGFLDGLKVMSVSMNFMFINFLYSSSNISRGSLKTFRKTRLKTVSND